MPLGIFLKDCCDFQYFHVPCYNNIKARVKSCGKYSAWILSVNERLHLFQRIFLLGLKTAISFICFTSQLNFRQECPVGRPEFFLSRPRSSFSRLRWPGAVRAQPWDAKKIVWLPLIHTSHIPASRINISRTEQPKNERKKEAVLQSMCVVAL